MNHVCLVVALVFCLFLWLFCVLYGTVQCLRLTGRDQMLAALKLWLERLPLRLEELIMVCGIFSWSLFLIARVLKGQCPEDATLFEQQTCNAYADDGGIPFEMAYSLYAGPLLLQLQTKNLSIRTLVMGHLSTLAVVSFCVFYSHTGSRTSVGHLFYLLILSLTKLNSFIVVHATSIDAASL